MGNWNDIKTHFKFEHHCMYAVFVSKRENLLNFRIKYEFQERSLEVKIVRISPLTKCVAAITILNIYINL